MKIRIIAVGTKMPAWVQQGYDEYAKRLPKEILPTLLEIPIGHRGKNTSVKEAKKQEEQAILQALPNHSKVVMLELKGAIWSTEQLSENLAGWQMEGCDVTFVIGGPDGFTQDVLQRADKKWCLSHLTLPHPLVRIVLIEQLYRAWTILQNHPYHK